MTKLKTISITAITLAIILAVLLNNKKQMAAQSVPDIQLTIPVRVGIAEMKPLAESFSLTGRVLANNDVTVVAEAEGRIVSVHAEVGDRVGSGATLVQIDAELKKAAYTSAEVAFENAKRDLARYEALREGETVSESQLESARLAAKAAEAAYISAKRQFEDARVTSPISGVVASRPVNVGAYLKRGDVVANVVDISTLKVLVNVAEKDVLKLRSGATVSITADVYPGVDFSGTIHSISDKADAAHTYAVEVMLPNSESHPMKAGMFARVEFNTDLTNSALAIPRDAISGSLRDPHVYVVEGNTAKLRHVVLGDAVGTMLPVISGLRTGEQIVLSGQNNLRDNSTITILQ